MPVTANASRDQYNGDGSTTDFTVTFYFLDNTHVGVIHTDSSGTDTDWVLDTHYTLSGAGTESGGTLTVKTSPTDYTPATGERLTIYRNVPLTQVTEYPAGGAFPSSVTTDTFDKVVMITQQLSEAIDRAVTVPVSDTNTSIELPNATTRATKYLAFDADGDPIATAGTDTSAIDISATQVTINQGGVDVPTIVNVNGVEILSVDTAALDFATNYSGTTAVTVGNSHASGVAQFSAESNSHTGILEAGTTAVNIGSTTNSLVNLKSNNVIRGGIAAAGTIFLGGGSATTCSVSVSYNNSFVNYLTLAGSTGTEPYIATTGTGTDVDIGIQPKGAGATRFYNTVATAGTNTVSTSGNVAPGGTNVAITAWIKIKDSAGTVRYVPCFS